MEDDEKQIDDLPDEAADAPTCLSFKLEEEIIRIKSELSRLHQSEWCN